MAKTSERTKGRPSPCMPTSAKNAGSITNSPWAKLMVWDACQSSVKPMAARA